MKCLASVVMIVMVGLCLHHSAGSVKPGDMITPDNASAVTDLVSPGNFYLVKQGMRLKNRGRLSASNGRLRIRRRPKSMPRKSASTIRRVAELTSQGNRFRCSIRMIRTSRRR